jgi:hypothetical protein
MLIGSFRGTKSLLQKPSPSPSKERGFKGVRLEPTTINHRR